LVPNQAQTTEICQSIIKTSTPLQTVLMLHWYCKSCTGNLVLNVEMLKLNVTSVVGISVVNARICEQKVTAL